MIFQPSINIQQAGGDGEWQRHSDWLSIDKPTKKLEFTTLFAVFDNQSNCFQFRIRLTTNINTIYVIDFGDGYVEYFNIPAGNTFYDFIHYYDYDSISDSTISNLGYKQVKINAYLQNELAIITSPILYFCYKKEISNKITVTSNILEIYIGRGFEASPISHDGYVQIKHPMLEYVYVDCVNRIGLNWLVAYSDFVQKIELVNTETITSCYQSFVGTRLLQNLKLNITNLDSLRYSFSGSGVKNLELTSTKYLSFEQTFNNTYTLYSLTCKLQSFNYAFHGSSGIRYIDFDLSPTYGGDIHLEYCNLLRSLKLRNSNTSLSYVNISNCDFPRLSILSLFTDLPDRTSTTVGNIFITGNRESHLITATDLLIATNKNWTVLN